MTEPVDGLTKLREVRVRADFTRIVKIDLQQQNYTASLRIEASWLDHELAMWNDLGVDINELYDDRLKGSRAEGYYRISDEALLGCSCYKNAKESEKEALLEKLKEAAAKHQFWYPRLKISNCLTMIEDAWWMKFYTSSGGPIACYRWDVTATLQELMELRLFPFDCQNLAVELITLWEMSHPSTPAVLVKQQNEDFPSVCDNSPSSFMQSSEYYLYDRVRFEQSITHPLRSSSRREYSMLRISCRIDRLANYWLLNVIFPLFIVTTSLFASFQLDYTDINGRCSNNLTILLALVAFKYVISDRLPAISYLTVIDTYLLACFAMSFFVLSIQIGAAMHVLDEPLLIWNQEATGKNPGGVAGVFATFVGARVRKRADAQNVEVNLMMVVLLLIWLLGHALSIIYVRLQLKLRDATDEFFSVPKNAVWLSPIDVDLLSSSASDIEVARKAIWQAAESAVGSGTVADVMLWTPDGARTTVKNSRGGHTGSSSSSSSSDEKTSPPPTSGDNTNGANGPPKPALYKTTSSRIAATEELAHLVERGIDPYKAQHNCAVVRFHSDADADTLTALAIQSEDEPDLTTHPLRSAIEANFLPKPRGAAQAAAESTKGAQEAEGDYSYRTPALRVRALNFAYYALAQRPTFARGSALPSYQPAASPSLSGKWHKLPETEAESAGGLAA